MRKCNSRLLFTVAILGAVLLASLPAQARTYSHERDGAVVGLNVGAGFSKLKFMENEQLFETENEAAAIGMFRIGYAKSEYFMLSLDVNAWSKQFDDTNFVLFGTLATATWFPGGQGWFLRGGGGIGYLNVRINRAYPVDFRKVGPCLGLGAGYELRLGPEWALGLAFDFRWIRLGDIEELNDVKALNYDISLQVNYYIL